MGMQWNSIDFFNEDFILKYESSIEGISSMPGTTKIAISLPEDIFSAIERERAASGETRSQIFRRAIISLLKEQKEKALDDEYVRGYQRIPETKEEAKAAYQAASIVLAEEPWE